MFIYYFRYRGAFAYPKVIKTKEYYFLFDIYGRFLVIPQSVFSKKEDELWFMNKIKGKQVRQI